MRNFKKLRGMKLEYNQQGLIYFICATIDLQPKIIQANIKELCREIARDNETALYDMLTRQDLNVVGIALKYGISEKTLYKWRKNFYECFFDRYLVTK